MSKSATLKLSSEQFRDLLGILSENPVDILLSGKCRRHLALDRWKKGDRFLEVHEDLDEGVSKTDSHSINKNVTRHDMHTMNTGIDEG